MEIQPSSANPLPLTRSLSGVYVAALIEVFLMVAASLGGVLFPSFFYPTEELRQSYMANDAVNLILGLPILIACIWFTRRGSFMALLLWPGALLYVFYNYLAYAFGNPLGWLTVVALALVALSVFVIVRLMGSIDFTIVASRLKGTVPIRTAGVVTGVFGLIFLFRSFGVIGGAFIERTALSTSEIGLMVADITLSLLWIGGGILMLGRKKLGYVGGLGLLSAACLLFVGLLIFFILQPFLVAIPFPLEDFLVIAGMSLVCFVPFVLFVRAIGRKA